MRSTARFTAPEPPTRAAPRGDATGWGLLAGRLLLAAVFLLAGISKVLAPTEFIQAVRAFNLLPDPLVAPFALILPWVEILAAVYLIVGFLGRPAAVATAAMLLMFIVALLDALVTGNTGHPCGCFGSTSNPVITALAGGDSVGWWDVIRDVILLAIALALVWRGPGELSIDEWVASRREAR
jgi:uncharacterized membrane protein YphA (DoxX/SURF4 family)